MNHTLLLRPAARGDIRLLCPPADYASFGACRQGGGLIAAAGKAGPDCSRDGPVTRLKGHGLEPVDGTPDPTLS